MREKINRWLELKRYNWKNLDISLLVVVSILLLISTYVLSIVQGDSFSLKRQLFGIIAGFVIVFIFVLFYSEYFENVRRKKKKKKSGFATI